MSFLIAIFFLQTPALHPASVVSGRVLNSDRTPASNTSVRLVPASKSDATTLPAPAFPAARRLAVADAGGAFQFTNVVPGDYTLQQLTTAGGGPKEVFLRRSVEEAQQAFTALQKITPNN